MGCNGALRSLGIPIQQKYFFKTIIAPETPNDECLPPPLIKNLRGIWQCVFLGDGGEVFRRSVGDSIRVISNFIGFAYIDFI